MPAPSGATMSKKAQSSYGQSLGPDGKNYVDKLFSEVESAWKSWHDGLKWGGISVSGTGVGAWTGTGTGGQLQSSSPFSMKAFVFKAGAPQQTKFTKGLSDALSQKFGAFPQSFKFSPISYTGVCGATALNPGPLSAKEVGVTLMAAGTGQNPSGIADLWKSFLTPPDFDFTNPNGKSEDLLKAIASTIEQYFQTVWLQTTMIVGNQFSTGALVGGVVAGFMTPINGKLV